MVIKSHHQHGQFKLGKFLVSRGGDKYVNSGNIWLSVNMLLLCIVILR